MESTGRGVLDTPLSRGMTAECVAYSAFKSSGRGIEMTL